ncbi:glycosyltransferase [Actinosynnema sp. NPDC047251]|uniref:Glycosyltransferase, family 4 n=1 Tax=Saccharothrix espanaensis (strain ATCC 51144 / DSM 44229 / JCM 9112 / NBRC 15066 / NRRL 15764) TaxID=1179773 RepID=K0JWT5_SACES|nr:glycosyltransferase [Saccharothrix espanaensis]CCH32325.1 Glycosyltransferase, family 4 [Saccharothrix espanaensis DSM 44229]
MKVLLWHVHGSWTHAFVQGAHDYLIVGPPDGKGLLGRQWPRAREVDLADVRADVAVVQEADQLDRVPGGVPVVYLEHNTPARPNLPHPVADRVDLIVHVTHFNRLMWDCGTTRTVVVEHGVVDPGPLYTGELARAAVVVNEPVRRGRVVGTDLLPRFADAAPLDVFGMGTERLPWGLGDHDLPVLHRELARRRVYVHPMRWTSLGLSLIEAMHLGMPVVALGCTEVPRAVPPDAGVVSTDVDELVRGVAELVADPALARERGARAREFALAHYGIDAFLGDWDGILTEVSG